MFVGEFDVMAAAKIHFNFIFSKIEGRGFNAEEFVRSSGHYSDGK